MWKESGLIDGWWRDSQQRRRFVPLQQLMLEQKTLEKQPLPKLAIVLPCHAKIREGT